jgi:cytochrome c biogenesis protein CcmG, thiol:disulfide interchange protein DsbE
MRHSKIKKSDKERGSCRWTRGELILAAMILVLLVIDGSAHAALRIGETLPAITYARANGTPLRVPDDVQGKVIVLHFWQIGCSSCGLEIPALDQLYDKYRNKGLMVLGVNVGQHKATVKGYAAMLKISYPILLDADSRSASLYDVTDVPRTYIIDRNNIVRFRIIGNAQLDVLKKLILSIL